jgi:hypothetical protein
MPENMIFSGAMPAARAHELAAGHHVGTLGELLDHRLVGIRLHGVADERLQSAKALAKIS